MSFAWQLRNDIQKVRETFPLLHLWEKGPFVRNLVLMFHVMRASEHLLETALFKTTSDDPIQAFFRSHLEEEREHEQWLRRDLLTAGIDVHETIIPVNVVEMVGTQYYLIHHVDPAALLGYMALLECFPMPMRTLDLLEAEHGEDLLRTVRFHAEHDTEHGADILKLVDELPPERQTIVRQSAIQSAVYLRAAIAANV